MGACETKAATRPASAAPATRPALCGGAPASTIVLSLGTVSTGHSFIAYESYVTDTVDSNDFNLVYTIDSGKSFYYPDLNKINNQKTNLAPDCNIPLLPKNILTLSAGSPTGKEEDALCAVANLEIIKAVYKDVDYCDNGYITWQVTQNQVDKMFDAFEQKKENKYAGITYNCTDVSINVWNKVFNTNITTKGWILPLFGICTPRGLMHALLDRSDGNSNYDLQSLLIANGEAELILPGDGKSGSSSSGDSSSGNKSSGG